jgi:biotin carboxylase
MIAMVFLDEESEQICQELGYNVILPPDWLRQRLNSKIVTTQLGNEAGAPSVPNVLGSAGSYADLGALSTAGNLGTDLVVQTAYRDSGKPRSSSRPKRTGTAALRASSASSLR